MIRLLMLVHNRVGITAFLKAQALSRWLAPMGYDITIIAGRLERGLKPLVTHIEGARVIQMPDLLPARIRHDGLSLMDIAARLGYGARQRYDLVHAFEPRPATVWPALVARKIWGSPYWPHGVRSRNIFCEILSTAEVGRLAVAYSNLPCRHCGNSADHESPAHRPGQSGW
jgi:hypothetical protein